MKKVVLEIEKAVNQSIKRSEQLCVNNGIEYIIHKGSPLWNFNDVVKESRFAGLVLLSEEVFSANINLKQPDSFLQLYTSLR